MVLAQQAIPGGGQLLRAKRLHYLDQEESQNDRKVPARGTGGRGEEEVKTVENPHNPKTPKPQNPSEWKKH